jgi:hypothetical protein
MIEFAGCFRLTQETPVEVSLHLYIHAGTRQKDFDGNLPLRLALVGEKYSTGPTVPQQPFQHT